MSALDSGHTDVATPLPAITRLDGLDWLRAGAAVLVVTLHAAIAYLVARMPGLAWSTHDPVGSPLVDAAGWWINGFIMPLFFMQSGFLAQRIMRRKGPREFLIHRSRRLLLPLALGCVLILPLDLYAWLLGWAADGKISLRKLRSLKIDGPLADNLWGVSHLWFLEYLWVFCVAAWIVCRVAKWRSAKAAANAPSDATARRRDGLSIAVASAALMAVSGVALWWEPQILIGFRHSWWPLPANVMFYAPWFALGWLVHRAFASPGLVSESESRRRPRQRGRKASCQLAALQNGMEVESEQAGSLLYANQVRLPFAAMCEWRLAAAIGLFAMLLPLIHRHVGEERIGGERILLVGLFVVHAWLMVTGLFGVSLRWLNRQPPRAVKYLADASFWIYLFHHPVVGLTQVSLTPLAIPAVAKFGLTTASALVLSLLTYQAMVHRTWVGALLNGRPLRADRRPSAADVLPLPLPDAEPMRKSA